MQYGRMLEDITAGALKCMGTVLDEANPGIVPCLTTVSFIG